jgi:type I restriction enzyme R subunit
VREPFAESVTTRFNEWLMDKAKAHAQQSTINHQPAAPLFTLEQLQWLNFIRDHIATSLSIEPDDFDYAPSANVAGWAKPISCLVKSYRGCWMN